MKLIGSRANGTRQVPDATSRRRLLAGLGSVTGIAIAGCLSGDEPDANPTFESGSIDADGEPRTAEEMSAAQGLAEEEIRVEATPMEGLDLVDHEFVLEDDYRGSTIQGTVENTGDDPLEIVEIRTRVYDDDGNQIGRYLDRTGSLGSDETWSFQVVVLEPPADLDAYDAAVYGMPA
ncbi:hypothetical protein CV102_00400 [Natronococcus pandeyae]|uniref:Uncharacterized protein n=1 Tax=Natronococcus pandeyae TaxID=2055836 RepID=A0A8J8Q418_9EURY|nr:FxLYD domain-containing protein [Natronococcus pandeyae]TYL40076.1 hypothetical protein CV102_00400 [Natronococcus pandeyae]